jgi:hypothetical protein
MAAKRTKAVESEEREERSHPPETGAGSAGQSGDLQGLSDLEDSENESIAELIEEGQFYEASLVDGVENAPDADQGPVRTHQLPEDDVPLEYTDRDPDEPRE